jgi:hypothetical protein
VIIDPIADDRFPEVRTLVDPSIHPSIHPSSAIDPIVDNRFLEARNPSD